MATAIHKRSKFKTVILMVCLVICVLSHAGICSDSYPLTFFGWSDQHVKTDGDGQHLIPAIDAMNILHGTAYPLSIGGKVCEPDFVMGLGDITEWPTRAAKNTYQQLISGRLKFPSYDVAGNHDSGGSVHSPTVQDWLIKRHGALSYTFNKKGVHFTALYSKYNESLNSPAQPISKEALTYLRTNLSKVSKDTPVVVATHLCFESITNKDELIDAFGDTNVILVLGGHYHKASVNMYRGISFVQLPSPAPGSPNEFTVIRIDPERLVAVPFDYEKGRWSTDPKKILNTEIRGPHKTSASYQFTSDHIDDVKCRPLLLDTHFRHGFLLSYPDSKKGHAVEAVLDIGDSNNRPIWRLCQWGTKHSLAAAHCIHHPDGSISYDNKAKRILVSAVDSDNRDLILEIRGSSEYGTKARKYGESWPHLLVEQQACKVYPLDQLTELNLTLSIKLLYSENHMTPEAYSPALHAAQFQLFLVIRNVNKQSKDCGNYYWFGVPFYDSRYDVPPSHKAKDNGKADATGMFIYTITGDQVYTEHLKKNRWMEIDLDLLPHIEAGLEEAARRGCLIDSNPGGYAVTEMNMGWEIPGTFDASIQIRDLKILAVLK